LIDEVAAAFDQGIYRNPASGVKKRLPTPFLSGHARKRCSSLLRQVTVWDAEHERELVFLTNIFHLAASTIGAIYKDRWQIELFF